MTDVPDNPATALERIFLQVRKSGHGSPMRVWTKVLKANPNTPEFAVRHAEVVLLVRRLQLFILALPETDPARIIYENDIDAWYNAVSHNGNWSTDSNAFDTMIEEDKVRLLGSLGQILSLRAQAEGNSYKPDVEELRTSLLDWKSLLDDVDLPPELRSKIRAQIEVLEYLLDEVETFGLEPVVEHGRTLFGLGISVLKVTGNVGKVTTAMSGLFTLITQISVSDYGQAANTLAGLFSSVSDVFTLASEEEEQKAIQARQQKQLTAKKEKTSEVVEGEVVAPEPPESPAPEDGEQG